ncbi:HNH endonuclease family protein [Streptomyces sp. NPDC058989]|uniref:HNH endonuclease family protein n=1 Tax=Streptomyces sp. NPDC058989 TaxID=3346686 RepID=UPI0036BEDD45
MINTRARWLVAVVTLALGAVLGPAAVTPAAAVPAQMPEPPSAEVVRTELADLTIEAPHSMNGYSRAKFPHWSQQGSKCDTREVVLKRDGQNVTQDDQCRAVSGSWHSLYDDKTLTSASQVDIDHMVPLANAWRSGADDWTTARRKQFANDLQHSQLIAVSAASNRSKGDQSPDQWTPPSHGYWCTYARAWTDVKHIYQLSVTQPEADRLASMLDTCA